MQQADRSRSIQRFKSGHARVLVATDVAATGLDVADISHLVYLDASKDKDTHVHRVGAPSLSRLGLAPNESP